MIRFAKVLTLLATATLVASSFGQGFGGGQGRRGMMGMMGGGMPPTAFLLMREDVQTELKLTNEQKDKLDEMRNKQRDKMREAFQEAQGDREAMGKIFAKLQEESDKDVAAVLTPEQIKRAKEIRIQFAGNMAVMDKDIAKEVGLTADQKAKLDELQKVSREASQSLMEKARNGEIQFQEVGERMRKNNEVLQTEVGKVLTEAQKAKLKDLGGAKFERKDDQV